VPSPTGDTNAYGDDMWPAPFYTANKRDPGCVWAGPPLFGTSVRRPQRGFATECHMTAGTCAAAFCFVVSLCVPAVSVDVRVCACAHVNLFIAQGSVCTILLRGGRLRCSIVGCICRSVEGHGRNCSWAGSKWRLWQQRMTWPSPKRKPRSRWRHSLCRKHLVQGVATPGEKHAPNCGRRGMPTPQARAAPARGRGERRRQKTTR
jgi:hypothetical protein